MRLVEVGWRVDVVPVDRVEGVRGEERRERGKERDDGEERQADHRGAVALETRERVLPERAASNLLEGPGGGRHSEAGHLGMPGSSVMAEIIANFGIKQAIDEVDREVEQDDDRSVEDDDAHDEGVIAVKRPLDEIAADAGNSEYLLDHYRAGDDAGNRRAELGHHWKESSPRPMAPDHQPPRTPP